MIIYMGFRRLRSGSRIRNSCVIQILLDTTNTDHGRTDIRAGTVPADHAEEDMPLISLFAGWAIFTL